MNIAQIKKVYLAGIGGMGLSYYFLNLKKEVSGSDLKESVLTEKLQKEGLEINFLQKKENIKKDIDLFIYTSALPPHHPELLAAQELKIKTLSYFEFLGLLSKNYKTIAIGGTNGKTTTTAILGLILTLLTKDKSIT